MWWEESCADFPTTQPDTAVTAFYITRVVVTIGFGCVKHHFCVLVMRIRVSTIWAGGRFLPSMLIMLIEKKTERVRDENSRKNSRHRLGATKEAPKLYHDSVMVFK